MFEIKKEIKVNTLSEYSQSTRHVSDRGYRYKQSKQVPHRAFIINKSHKNGLELHVICEDATVLIYNLNSKRLITILNARVGQLKRYGITKKEILREANLNTINNLNK